MKIEVTEEHCKMVLQIFELANVQGKSAKKLVELMEVYERALQEISEHSIEHATKI